MLSQLPAHTQAVLSGRTFFPELIQAPFRNVACTEAFAFAILACLIAAVASWSRGQRYVDGDAPVGVPVGATAGAAGTPVTAAAESTAR